LGLILKNHLIINCLTNFLSKEVKNQNMNRKIKLLALISIVVVLAAVATSLVLAAQSTVKADTTTAVASDVTSPLAVNAPNNGGFFNNGYMGFGGPGGVSAPCDMDACASLTRTLGSMRLPAARPDRQEVTLLPHAMARGRHSHEMTVRRIDRTFVRHALSGSRRGLPLSSCGSNGPMASHGLSQNRASKVRVLL
jgi:hypothetical protein